MIYPVILAGGKGERFWPYSNSRHPKQLLPLVTKKSMMEDTLANIRHFHKNSLVHLVISRNLESPVRKLLKNRKNVRIVVEPSGKNTAAAIALAGRLIATEDPLGTMLVLTADHAISPPDRFRQAMRAAVDLAKVGDCLVTFGIKPHRPEIGYGYIESGGTVGTSNGLPAHRVKGFHEKPDLKTAEKYLRSGRYFWNSGMFAWRVDYLWKQFERSLPAVWSAFEAEKGLNGKSPKLADVLKRIYKKLPEVSIDKGIMESADSIRMVVPEFTWDDIGSWSSLDRLHQPDKVGNRSLGEVVALESAECTFFSDQGLIAAFGVKGLLIVQHEGVTLVIDKNRASEIKRLVKMVQERKELKSYL